ncbi:periplasmic binding protein-like II [Neocallimastix lanati (nom. inval.)]|uniref:Periplasmic binding protein-like II n=1 Tax=Neocallimastix californiae TaxID=1754190 RepID=A0A1Y2A5V8_9FUNG|nr:periplasmic binding protein-like II [Neocallimastix sp. JGI-2020a]ORY17888.1 periplasmic binding protein-like II [Neocallimastix californiae]|eukprot:ORY17888.1 periplasmic binding protein-like II [Neocallimastix californiae]
MFTSYYTILLFIFFIEIGIVYSVVINAIAFTQNGGGTLYSPIINEFNQLSKDQNLDISIKLNLLSSGNSTTSSVNYEELLDSIFKRKSKKYDLIFYDNIYTSKFEPYLLDLNNLLPEEHIKMYIPGVITQIGYHNNKLVGFPITIDYTVIYCNDYFLNKYNKTIPKTWDELIDTGQYILNEEKKMNNTEFVVFNGYLDDSEQGTCSIYEFIYSCRDSKESKFPELTNQTTINALKKLKEIKNKISSDEIFKSGLNFLFKKLNEDKNFLFLKFWYLHNKNYTIIPLPGIKEGISGSVLGGHNLGISIYSDSNIRDYLIKVFMFITSKNMQRKYMVKRGFYSPISSLYDEDEVCKEVNCEFFKSIQLIARPTNKIKDYDLYSSKFRNYIYDYLYGDKKAEDVLKIVNEITQTHYLSLKTDETHIGLIIFIITVILSVVILTSSGLLLITQYKLYFNFTSIDLWFIIIIGLFICLLPIYMDFGPIYLIKCYLRFYFNLFGRFLIYVPILIQLLINIPEKDIFLFLLFDVLTFLI